MKSSGRCNKSICLPFASETEYERLIADATAFRKYVTEHIGVFAELFPTGIEKGFDLHSLIESAKTGIRMRRIRVRETGAVYQIRPSFVLPYQVGRTEEVEKAMYLLQFGVPFEALAYVFGRTAMYWYRIYTALGSLSMVGTTVKSARRLPEHLAADEKITWLKGEEIVVATTVGGGCFLGAAVAVSADAAALTEAYGVFAAEARNLDAAYRPHTVNTDGWEATRKAWRTIFHTVTLIQCFLHAILKLRDRCRRSVETWREVSDRLWEVYAATSKRAFGQRLRRLSEWGQAHLPDKARDVLLKISTQRIRFTAAYDFPEACRTSNAVDRLIDHLDHRLYAARYLHRSRPAATRWVRAAALLWNFHPYGSRARAYDGTRHSPFHDLNGFVYHDNWFHNLLIASSLGGRRQ